MKVSQRSHWTKINVGKSCLPFGGPREESGSLLFQASRGYPLSLFGSWSLSFIFKGSKISHCHHSGSLFGLSLAFCDYIEPTCIVQDNPLISKSDDQQIQFYLQPSFLFTMKPNIVTGLGDSVVDTVGDHYSAYHTLSLFSTK